MPQGHLSERTRMAFDNAWALQSKSGPDAGAWVWQNFDYTPWESKESQYHWAALMALAVGSAPDNYRNDPKIAANLAALRSYLQSHYDAQPLVNKIVALWAGKYFPGVLTRDQSVALSMTSIACSTKTAAGASPNWARGNAVTTPRSKPDLTAMPPDSSCWRSKRVPSPQTRSRM